MLKDEALPPYVQHAALNLLGDLFGIRLLTSESRGIAVAAINNYFSALEMETIQAALSEVSQSLTSVQESLAFLTLSGQARRRMPLSALQEIETAREEAEKRWVDVKTSPPEKFDPVARIRAALNMELDEVKAAWGKQPPAMTLGGIPSTKDLHAVAQEVLNPHLTELNKSLADLKAAKDGTVNLTGSVVLNDDIVGAIAAAKSAKDNRRAPGPVQGPTYFAECHFAVYIDGSRLSGISKVIGICRGRMGINSYEGVTLVQGVSEDRQLAKWWDDIAKYGDCPQARRQVRIAQLDRDKTTVIMSYTYKDALIVEYDEGNFDATSPDFRMTTVKFLFLGKPIVEVEPTTPSDTQDDPPS